VARKLIAVRSGLVNVYRADAALRSGVDDDKVAVRQHRERVPQRHVVRGAGEVDRRGATASCEDARDCGEHGACGAQVSVRLCDAGRRIDRVERHAQDLTLM